MRIGVVDHGAGNLVSIDQAVGAVGGAAVRVLGSGDLDGLDGLIVPGVGASGPAMDRLAAQGLVDPIRAWIERGRPLLGICLGLQLLFEGSDEDGARTLGAVPGRTVELVGAPTLPHVGWNAVVRRYPHPLFDGIAADAPFYFVHSYVGAPRRPDVILAETEHGGRFVSAIARGALLGVQFHPERSGPDGLRLLGNFVGIVRAAAPASGRSAA